MEHEARHVVCSLPTAVRWFCKVWGGDGYGGGGGGGEGGGDGSVRGRGLHPTDEMPLIRSM